MQGSQPLGSSVSLVHRGSIFFSTTKGTLDPRVFFAAEEIFPPEKRGMHHGVYSCTTFKRGMQCGEYFGTILLLRVPRKQNFCSFKQDVLKQHFLLFTSLWCMVATMKPGSRAQKNAVQHYCPIHQSWHRIPRSLLTYSTSTYR